MGATLYIMMGMLAVGQAGPGEREWPLTVRLQRGQELLYRGHYNEETGTGQVRFSRSYRLENRVFVIDSSPDESDIAVLTLWRGRASEADRDPDLSSVRLETAKLTGQGQLRSTRSLAVPLDGPPTIEVGFFVSLPRESVAVHQPWSEPVQPLRTWTITAIEPVGNTRCLKLVGEQESPEWQQPRADQLAWKRRDTVWLNPQTGFAHRVERVLERREPGHRDAGHRTILRYELESILQYPGQLYGDRKREIEQAVALYESVSGYLPRAGQVGARPFEVLLSRIKYFQEQYPPTPYRQAVEQVQRLAEAGRRGEVPPALPEAEPVQAVAHVISAGKPAPDFLARDFVTQDSTRLKHWLGRPVLMIFFKPTSASADELLRFAQRLDDQHRNEIHVLTLALTDDAKAVLDQRERLKLYVPALSGTGLRLSYAVEATPKLVVLDAAGVVQASFVGWGPETPASVLAELKRCVQQR